MIKAWINKQRAAVAASASVLVKKLNNRRAAANLLMLSFILFTAIGCFQIYAPAGFISAGITCGLFGFLLGQE